MDSEFGQEFTVAVATPDLKFNCAHFIAFQNFRERLHGHNYTVSVKLCGASVGNDGYLLDFGEVKRQCKLLCAKMNERFICPMLSDVLNINDDDASQVSLYIFLYEPFVTELCARFVSLVKMGHIFRFQR